MNKTLLTLSLWSVAAAALFSACAEPQPQGITRSDREATPGAAQLMPHDVRDLLTQMPAEGDLVDLVRAAVAGDYSAELQQGQLFVRATMSEHEAINTYLTDLRGQYAAH